MDRFIIDLFPQGSLANSVTTTVWVGIWVYCLLNLRFGWSLSGLVVPGYLVPLMLVKPVSAVVVVGEAVITYLLVWLYSEQLPRLGFSNSLFGRDRFFALLLTSVMVRLVFDTIFLPIVGQLLNASLHLNIDYRHTLHSFGLIVVALIANQFWKPGLRRGILPLTITVTLTYAIVRYVLMELTNFSVGNLAYMYEDVATSMLASPKSYIILLTSAYIASRMNLHYGWEYSGILIPSLLALQWYQPIKLAVTFGESFIILGFAIVILRLPLLKNANVEGARKILLFFNIGFFYQLFLGHYVIFYYPELPLTDLYGFGYLLTTLMAVKMHDKGIAARLTRATLQTSLVAVLAAGAVGFVLTYVPQPTEKDRPAGDRVRTPNTDIADERLVDVIRTERIGLYRARTTPALVRPTARERAAFAQALAYIDAYAQSNDTHALKRAKALLESIHYGIDKLENRYLYLSEEGLGRGWGTYVINPSTESHLVIEIPAPLDEWGVAEAGTWLFSAMQAKGLALAGAAGGGAQGREYTVLAWENTLFGVFQDVLGKGDTLQLRSWNDSESAPAGRGLRQDHGTEPGEETQSIMWVKQSLPPGLDVHTLTELMGRFRVEWAVPPFPNALRDNATDGFAELMLSRSDILQLMFRPAFAAAQVAVTESDRTIVGYIQDWLFKEKGRIAEKGTNLYVPPTREQLLYFDQEIVTPVLNIVAESRRTGELSDESREALRTVSVSASALNYQVIRYRHAISNEEYIVLSERPDAPTRYYWGTYVFRVGPAHNYLVQIPRPLSELRIVEYSVSLFERVKGAALCIAGAHPLANMDLSADVVSLRNQANVFNLVSQAVLRETGVMPMLVVQCRAFGYKPEIPPPEDEVLMALNSGLINPQLAGPLVRQLLQVVRQSGLTVDFVDGSLSSAGYGVGGLPQARYLKQTLNKELALLWLSPLSRAHYRQQTENRTQNQQFRALGVPTREADLFRVVSQGFREGSKANVPPELKQAIRAYTETYDVAALQRIVTSWPQYRYQRVIDISSKQSFLAVYEPSGGLCLVANLSPRAPYVTMTVQPGQLDRARVNRFIDARMTWLEP